MILKSCGLFGQDHATKQTIRAKWRFDFSHFALLACFTKMMGNVVVASAALAPRSSPESAAWTLDCFDAKRRLAKTGKASF
jgi:hypothetical protein